MNARRVEPAGKMGNGWVTGDWRIRAMGGLMLRKLGFVGLGLVAGLLPGMAAMAAEGDEAGSLAEIVVTAQKRTESVQDVPVSITVVSAEQLERQGVTNIADLSRSSASLEFGAPGTSSPGGGGFVRGIGTNSFGYSAQASVGIVLDGVVMGNANLLSLFDLQRVEILKGPQGTLFGNSVSAGVINITTKAPDPSKRSFQVSGEFADDGLGSDYSRYVVRAVANLPITDTSALRISAHSEQNRGVGRNIWLGKDGQAPDDGVRIRYMAQPTDALTINVIGDWNKASTHYLPTLTYRSVPTNPPFNNLALALSDCGITAGEDNFDYCSEHDDRSSDLVRGLSGQIDYKLNDDITLTSITAWRGRKSSSRTDIQSIPLAITQNRLGQFTNCFFFNCLGIYAILPGYSSAGPQVRDAKQISEELRLASSHPGKIDWVAGVFYQDYKNDVDEGGLINGFFTGGFFGDTGHFAKIKTTDYAAFGTLTYHFTDTFRGILGARYTHSKVSEVGNDISVAPPNNTMDLSVSASKFNYRAGVQMDFTPHFMGYVTLSTGYKGPQIANDISGEAADPGGGHVAGVRPEIPTSAEIGVKYSAFDNRLAIDADVFYTRVKDYQGQLCQPNNQGTITCVPGNVDKVITKGVELDIFGRPFAGLTLNLSGIYNPAKYPGGYLASDSTDLGGTQLTRSSKSKVTFSGEYSHALTGNTDWVIGADATHRSKQSIYPSADQMFVVKGGTIYNARIGLRSGENWGVYLFGRNLGNKHFPRDLFPTPFQPGGLWQVYDASGRKIIGLQFDATF